MVPSLKNRKINKSHEIIKCLAINNTNIDSSKSVETKIGDPNRVGCLSNLIEKYRDTNE
jgi:hypothetical protein